LEGCEAEWGDPLRIQVLVVAGGVSVEGDFAGDLPKPERTNQMIIRNQIDRCAADAERQLVCRSTNTGYSTSCRLIATGAAMSMFFVDWGTSSMRLWSVFPLVGEVVNIMNGKSPATDFVFLYKGKKFVLKCIHDSKDGIGVHSSKSSLERALMQACKTAGVPEGSTIVASGMAGSTVGLRNTAYTDVSKFSV